jgi:tRNA U55 pseudouridine synthase TruB
MESLRRVGVDPFDIVDAKLMEDLNSREQILQALVPASDGLPHMPPFECDREQIRDLSHGKALEIEGSLRPGAAETWAKALAPDGKLFAIGKVEQKGDKLVFRPKKVLGATQD